MFFRSLRRLLAAVLLTLCGVAGALAQQAESRFAFVIGNDAYEAGASPTAANDAALVADALRLAGFDVTGARNLDQDTLRAAYREFLAKVAAAGRGAVAALYFSGQGAQLDGENYFIPPGARLARESDFGLNAIRISDLTRPLAGLNGRANLILLDLAYASPQTRDMASLAPGLALIEPERSMLVSVNQAPGLVATPGAGPYGPYAQAISEMMRVAGLNADEVFDRVRIRASELSGGTQVPWHASRIDPPLVLLERGADAPAPAAQATIERLKTAPIRDLNVKEGYAAAVRRDRIEDYEAYIAAHPDAEEARRARALLAARREATFWARTAAVHTPNSYWTYLKRYPNGPHASDARRRLARLSAAAEPPQQFDMVDYGVAPPPREEEGYFDTRRPFMLEPGRPIEILEDAAPPPRWWRPPPPPVFDDEDDYFLPVPQAAAPPPAWVAPPAYVAEPVMPYRAERAPGATQGILPYVAIPAALAAGIVAGKLLNKKQKQQTGAPGAVPPGASPPASGGVATAPPRPRFMPPVTSPPGQTHAPSPTAVRTSPPLVTPPIVTPPAVTAPPVTGTRPPATQTTLPGIVPPPAGTPPRAPGAIVPPPVVTAPAVTTPPATGTRPPATQTTQPGIVQPPAGTPPRAPGAIVPPPVVTAPAVTTPPATGTRPPATQTTQPGIVQPPAGTPPRAPGTIVPPPIVTAPAVTTPPTTGTRPPATQTTQPGIVPPPAGTPPRAPGAIVPPPVVTAPAVTTPPVTGTRPPATQTTQPGIVQPPAGTPPRAPGAIVPPPVVTAPAVTTPPTTGTRPPATQTTQPTGPTPAQLEQQRREAQQRAAEAARQQQLQQQQVRQQQLQVQQQKAAEQVRQQQAIIQQRAAEAAKQQQVRQQQMQQMQQQRAAEAAKQQQVRQQQMQQMQQQRAAEAAKQQQARQQQMQQMQQQRAAEAAKQQQARQQQMQQRAAPPRTGQPPNCGKPGQPRCR